MEREPGKVYVAKRIGSCTVDEVLAYCDSRICNERCEKFKGKSIYDNFCKIFGNDGRPDWDLDQIIDVPLDEPKVPLDDEFETILICAHRYAMGRLSYMPRLVMDYTRPYLPRLSDRFLSVFLRDLEQQESWGPDALGDKWITDDWHRFRDEVLAEQKRRRPGGEQDE